MSDREILETAAAALAAKMAPLAALIDTINERLAPVDAEIDALIAQQQALQAKIDVLVQRLATARGMGAQEYLELKRRYGEIAARRMAILAELKA